MRGPSRLLTVNRHPAEKQATTRPFAWSSNVGRGRDRTADQEECHTPATKRPSATHGSYS
jgi:hypothetical protein